MRNILCGFILTLLAGCAAPRDGESLEGREILIGVVMVDYETGESATYTETSVAGFWINGADAGAGIRNNTRLRMKSACQVIFLIENEDQLARAAELVQSTLDAEGENICVIGQ